jgi:hypothetical protein
LGGDLTGGHTVPAGSVKDDFVILDLKSRGGHRLDPIEAAWEVKDLAALAAQKVVMVAFVGPFIPRGLAGNFHRHDLPVLGKGFEGPIHGGDSKGGHFLHGCLQNFRRGERVGVIAQNGRDRSFLPSASVHGQQ